MASRSLSLPRIAAPRAMSRVSLPRPRLKIVAITLIVAAGMVGGWSWFRDSSLVAASDVRITGVDGPQAASIRQALRSAAGEMTTLNVRPAVLRQAVAEYPLVKSVSATANFPHKLGITVVEHRAVAAIAEGGRHVPVAEDGTILRGTFIAGLTLLHARTASVGRVVTDPFEVAAVHVLAAAPTELRHRVTKIFMGPRGLTLHIENAPVVAFGSGLRASAKWVAVRTMLMSASIAGATIIDVSVPERPAVSGLAAPVPPAGATTAVDPTSTPVTAPVTQTPVDTTTPAPTP